MADEQDLEEGGRPRKKSVDRIEEPARALVLVPDLRQRGGRDDSTATTQRDLEARLEEAFGLARAIDLDVRATTPISISQPKPATLFGTGKVEEIGETVKAEEIDLVIVDHALTPIQQRNLEKAWQTKVIDRTGLILEIFGERARTREGRLQVELAHLKYQKSRLVRSWTHLERQRGGFGFLGGPGETQIEADRRQLQEKITRIEADLEQVKRTRDLHRRQRRKAPHPVVALVGYTNAGKSTLFNHLTEADVFAKDLLFATLDPTLRRIKLPHGTDAILSDTVGFISNLPTHLVAAFRATLEEVIEASIILHVRDISHKDTEAQASDVAEVLKQLGLNPEDRDRIIEVWNKIDLVEDARRDVLLAQAKTESPGGQERHVVSAITGEGLDELLSAIEVRLVGAKPVHELALDPADGAGLAWLYDHGEVLERHEDDDGTMRLTVRIADKSMTAFHQRYGERIQHPLAEN